ncbi:hypothetical protein SAE01_29800 [Segetibacter aerophilus]|uniref:Uncharacterized protein n=1 Tax=Segetibacter aerophilus TaxID=670293 RepID=A0A512BEW3_9BACT|nr:hypothetical protein SAE01_29800 [Segetibacter aerophilus]
MYISLLVETSPILHNTFFPVELETREKFRTLVNLTVKKDRNHPEVTQTYSLFTGQKKKGIKS